MMKKKPVKERHYIGDGVTTCAVCGKILPWDTHVSSMWAYKQTVLTRRRTKRIVNYCSYGCMRKDQ